MRRSATRGYASLACVACRRLKRKCTRELPSCNLCAKVRRPCEYQDSSNSPTTSSKNSSTSRNLMNSTESVPELVTRGSLAGSGQQDHPASNPQALSVSDHRYHLPEENVRPSSCASWFVDSGAARGHTMKQPGFVAWSEVVDSAPALSKSEALNIFENHFRSTHSWLPIVSKVRVRRCLQDYSEDVGAVDLVALLYAMDLLTKVNTTDIGEKPSCQAHYRAIKSALLACAYINLFSTNFLAANVLIATWEMAHGIYPVAYLSISHCSRIFYALGLHDKSKAIPLSEGCDTWTEGEERRRLWWAVILLDRYVHVGFRFRPLSIPSVPQKEILPADDEAWDRGELTVNALLVMSVEAQTNVSPFARTCQAANLLGKVCEHLNDHASPADTDLHLQEATQILRAIQSLKIIVDDEFLDVEKKHRLFTAKAVCMSALMLMYDVHGCMEEANSDSNAWNRGLRLDLQKASIDGCKTAAEEVSEFADELTKTIEGGRNHVIGPFVLYCLYSAAGTWAWLHRETGDDKSYRMLEELRKVLVTLQQRWSIASEYVALLRGIEHSNLGDNYR